MGVHVVEVLSGLRSAGFLVISLEYPGDTTQQAIDYVRDHSYRPARAFEVFDEAGLPPKKKTLATCQSMKRRIRVGEAV